MMAASADLTRTLAEKYNIPMTEVYINGHSVVPGCSTGLGGGKGCHTDPGQHFDWPTYYALVTDGDWVPVEPDEEEPVTTGALVGFVRDSDIYSGADIANAKVQLGNGQVGYTEQTATMRSLTFRRAQSRSPPWRMVSPPKLQRQS